MANKPTVAWAETTPAGNSAITFGDDYIREFKTQIREIMEASHIFESSGQGEAWGYHKQVTFNEQSGNPTAVAGSVILFTKEVSGKCELHCIDEDSNVIQLTSVGHFVGGMSKEVRMWSGTLATIPAGWALCDGSGSLPNLLAKFIRGVSTAATNPGTTGGSHELSSVLPTHTHSRHSDGTHGHPIAVRLDVGSAGGALSINNRANFGSVYVYNTGADAHYDHSHTTTSYGDSTNIDNRPAYYELAFIARQ